MLPIHEFEIKNMLRLAAEAKERSYAPYTQMHVGVCLKGGTGAYYLGCNVENKETRLTICAERVALSKAIFECERSFEAMAIIGDSSDIQSTCEDCVRILAEFCGDDMPFIFGGGAGIYNVIDFGSLCKIVNFER